MALRIGGGDWSPWAGVGHQLVQEQQGQQSLNLRARQLRDQREAQQHAQYMRELGFEEGVRQFDETQGLRKEELGAKFFRDAEIAAQKAADLKFRMEEAGIKRGTNEAEIAVRMGVVSDASTGKWRKITPDDELYEAHKEYVKGKRSSVNKNMELNRRIQFIDGKIRNNEKILADLRSEIDTQSRLKKPTEALEEKMKAVQRELNADRQLYNKLYEQFFKGYGGVSPENEAAARFVESYGQGGGAGGLPVRTGPGIAPQGAGQMTEEEMTEPLGPGEASADIDRPFTQKDLENMASQQVRVSGRSYVIRPKFKARALADRQRIMKGIITAQRKGDQKMLQKLLKERREYVKKHRAWFKPVGRG